MSFLTKFMRKNDSDVLDAASTVACIGKLADDLRVDSEERLKMLRRGLVNFPELVAALPPVDDDEDLFISQPTVVNSKFEHYGMPEEWTFREKDINKKGLRVDYFVNCINDIESVTDMGNTKECDLFTGFHHCSKYYDVSHLNRDFDLNATNLIDAAYKMGYLSGALNGYDGKGLSVTDSGKKYFSIDGRTVRWNYDNFMQVYKELALVVIKDRI